MNGLGVGSVVGKQDKEVLVDPSREEEGRGDASVCLGVMPAVGRVTNVWFTGEAEVDEACEVSAPFFRLRVKVDVLTRSCR